jgi:hypothetical protein
MSKIKTGRVEPRTPEGTLVIGNPSGTVMLEGTVVFPPSVEMKVVPTNTIVSIFINDTVDVEALKEDSWFLCDGSEGTPDLTGQFIRGGIPGLNVTGLHITGTMSTDEYTLTTADMPSHNHTLAGVRTVNAAGSASDSRLKSADATQTGSTGDSGAHSHPMNSTPDHVYIGYFMYKGVA